ncbi:anti-phage defense-associated sirtuin Dsr1 [Paraburkholderia tropica]|uniref:anti-phage defense-associated sirtuin Dsr1 n=1 Tax=Paraburkholderia tropica TaxID=92647 RepID=UPI002ABE6E41|nr:anti-phage defense-associated sirtuin Dsr1 [Paraburkholderia tropica]
MQFVANGADIPDELIQAHEEGRVVFFCGAGISYPAGLPGFGGLVEKIYAGVGASPESIEQEAIKRLQFDAALDLLEHRLPGQRLAVRRAMAKALSPNLRLKGAMDTQAALLQLARDRQGSLRLVTTNFDHVFHKAAKRAGQPFQSFCAPMLPIPKNSRWDGVVFLHGLLPEKEDSAALNRLVVTSGDFGLAYLTERWAARFVSELFRNYVVCFVGYSINDPVLRYMMDALAADRMLGESTPQAWAIGECSPGQEAEKTREWKAKGVTPILYEVPTGTYDHSAFHKTLHAWAETYRDGILGKEKIVVSHALAKPAASTRQDDFVGRVLWALADKSGLPARRFADFNPVPSLEWLFDAFSSDRFEHRDLPRFGVTPNVAIDENLKFSLVNRPTPYAQSPRMRLTSEGVEHLGWDDVMHELARWLTRHLDDARLILWIVQRGGRLQANFLRVLHAELERFARLEESQTTELDYVRQHAPNAVPGPMMRKLWSLLLSGRLRTLVFGDAFLFRWAEHVKREGLTAGLQLELRELLAPKIELSSPLRWALPLEDGKKPTRLRQLVDWKIVLAADNVASIVEDLPGTLWQDALPRLMPDFQQLLLDAMNLQAELGTADGVDGSSVDRTYWQLPSISTHEQNRSNREWIVLIEMLRDAWLAILLTEPERAARIAENWFDFPYPTFKRLALFAASQTDHISPQRWAGWLLAADARWLWSIHTKREMCRLLVLQGNRLPAEARDALEAGIDVGPPREMYSTDITDEQWLEVSNQAVWLRLAKLQSSGCELGERGRSRLEALSLAHPEWGLSEDERDEFSQWRSSSKTPSFVRSSNVRVAPRKRHDLIQFLTEPISQRASFDDDGWKDVCRTRFFHSWLALRELAGQGNWPTERWREALEVWSEDGVITRSWRHVAALVQLMPNEQLVALAHPLTWWIEAASKITNEHRAVVLDMSRRFLVLPLEERSAVTRDGEEVEDAVLAAINHPVGHIAAALLNLWFKEELNDNERLSPEFEKLFTQLCDVQIPSNRHGRVLLATNVIGLFRVDREWTQRNLLPFFDWATHADHAKGTWQGFLWSTRLYWPLLDALKTNVLATSAHYGELGEYGPSYAGLLTLAALEPAGAYVTADFREAFRVLPVDGLRESAQVLSQMLEAAGEQREEYWKHRVLVMWANVWPKSRELATPEIADSLARLCVSAGGQFPAAVAAVWDWLKPVAHPDYVVREIQNSMLASQYPQEALGVLDRIIADDPPWVPDGLVDCLRAIAQKTPELLENPGFVRLQTYLRRRGLDVL